MPIASRLAPTGSVVFIHVVYDAITEGASQLALTGSVVFIHVVYDAITVGASLLAMAAPRSKRIVT
jgi:hypothetical protein